MKMQQHEELLAALRRLREQALKTQPTAFRFGFVPLPPDAEIPRGHPQAQIPALEDGVASFVENTFKVCLDALQPEQRAAGKAYLITEVQFFLILPTEPFTAEKLHAVETMKLKLAFFFQCVAH